MNVRGKSAFCIVIMCISTAVLGEETSIARRDNINIAIKDVEAQHFMLSDARIATLLRNELDLLKSIEDGLNARVYAQVVHPTKKYAEVENRYITNQVERTYLAAALNVHERRIRAAFRPESDAVVARAKELWLADTDKFFDEESVDISQIHFDTQKRSWRETQQRIDEAATKLRNGQTFASVAGEYSDDPAASSTSGKIQGVRASIADGYLRAILFNKLKLGEISEPTPARRGIYIVRLDKKSEQTKKPFEAVKNEIIASLLETDARNARIALLLELEKTPTALNEVEIRKHLPKAEIDVNELMRKIHRERGISVSEPVKTQ